MQRRILVFLFALALSGCGSHAPTTHAYYGQLNNDRVFGTVVSVNQGEKPATPNPAAAKGNDTSGSFFTRTFNSISNSITGQTAVETVPVLHYIIRKDDGQQMTIDQTPDSGESILYPGQRVMVQSNGEYLRVYPANVEDPLQQHVPGAARESN